jgi:hypothetical protein
MQRVNLSAKETPPETLPRPIRAPSQHRLPRSRLTRPTCNKALRKMRAFVNETAVISLAEPTRALALELSLPGAPSADPLLRDRAVDDCAVLAHRLQVVGRTGEG